MANTDTIQVLLKCRSCDFEFIIALPIPDNRHENTIYLEYLDVSNESPVVSQTWCDIALTVEQVLTKLSKKLPPETERSKYKGVCMIFPEYNLAFKKIVWSDLKHLPSQCDVPIPLLNLSTYPPSSTLQAILGFIAALREKSLMSIEVIQFIQANPKIIENFLKFTARVTGDNKGKFRERIGRFFFTPDRFTEIPSVHISFSVFSSDYVPEDDSPDMMIEFEDRLTLFNNLLQTEYTIENIIRSKPSSYFSIQKEHLSYIAFAQLMTHFDLSTSYNLEKDLLWVRLGKGYLKNDNKIDTLPKITLIKVTQDYKSGSSSNTKFSLELLARMRFKLGCEIQDEGVISYTKESSSGFKKHLKKAQYRILLSDYSHLIKLLKLIRITSLCSPVSNDITIKFPTTRIGEYEPPSVLLPSVKEA